MFLEVMNLPSLPANGDVFTQKFIETVGSSTDKAGKASTFEGSQIVSEIFNSPKPVTAIMSPASAQSTGALLRPK